MDMQATKIAYINGNGVAIHSSVIIKNDQVKIWVVSKWGEDPLIMHEYADCEFHAQSLSKKYLKKAPPNNISITGNNGSELVSTDGATFNLSNSGQASSWIAVPENFFTITSTSASATVKATTTANIGQIGAIRAILNNGKHVYKYIEVGQPATPSLPPSPYISGANTVCYEGSQFILNYPPSGSGTITWTVSNTNNFTVTSSGNPTTVKRKGTSSGNATLSAYTSSGQFITQTSITPCSPPIFNGPPAICSSPVTFSISNLPSNVTGSQVVWTCSSNLTPQGGNTGASKTFIFSGSSSAWVKAEISTINVVFEKNLAISLRPTYTTDYRTTSSYIYLTPPYSPGVIKYKWTTNGSIYVSPSGPVYGISVGFSFNSWVGASHTIWVYAVTACGESTSPDHVYYITIGRSGSSSYIIAYPNPVNDILTIEIDGDAAQALLPVKTSLTFDVRLYDEQGNLLHQAKTKGGVVQFNVGNFPDGIYYLHVYDGVNSMPEMMQIMVEH